MRRPSLSEFRSFSGSIATSLKREGVSYDDIVTFLCALDYVKKYGVTPEYVHLRLVQLYCSSSGRIQDLISSFFHLDLTSQISSIQTKSELFSISAKGFTDVLHALSVDGYALLHQAPQVEKMVDVERRQLSWQRGIKRLALVSHYSIRRRNNDRYTPTVHQKAGSLSNPESS
jgi:hypothetical protein